MILRVLIAVLLSIPIPALGQPLFGDPLAAAAAYRSERGSVPQAAYQVIYEASDRKGRDAATRSERVFVVAADWSLVRDGERAVLRDFRLNRTFLLQPDGFTTANGAAMLVFRVMERQNRAFLAGLLAKTGAEAPRFDACSLDSELGVQLPGTLDAPKTSVREQRGRVELKCEGRRIGWFESGEGVEPPPAFWPTAFEEMPTHPELHRRMRANRKTPEHLEVVLGNDPTTQQRKSWKLVSIDSVSVAYPLLDDMPNRTAARLDEIVGPGTAQLALDAIAGRAGGGAPTRESWGRHLESLTRRRGSAVAAMALLPSLNMFPGLERDCAQAFDHPACGLSRDLPEIAKSDPATQAVLDVALAEQQGDALAAIDAMARARKSPLRDDPVLGASFALAVLRFDASTLEKTRSAGLPTDVAALQARALAAYPYNPAYWTDIGDRLGGAYEWPDAFLLFDVAFSLPMPEALAESRVLRSKRDGIDRIRRDFPEAFLQR
jgi:hypothetical protein